jgi:hypothetical protein
VAAVHGPVAALLQQIPVATPDPGRPPYDRDAFGDWAYDPSSGCNTRERVLIEESLDPPVLDDRCHPQSGRWVSVYDRVATTDPDDLQIDHLVALADAWRSGASAWTEAQRHAFANDLDDPGTLVAVTSRTNQSKGDSTPDEWLPPDRTSWCGYSERWVRVKARWRLSVEPAEKAALVRILEGC